MKYSFGISCVLLAGLVVLTSACQKKKDSAPATSSDGVVIDTTKTGGSHVLTVSKLGNGAGTVVSSPAGINCGSDCSEGFPLGTIVELTATPGNGLVSFNGWSGACAGTGSCIVIMDATKTISPIFKNFINNPSVIGFSNSYSSQRHFIYEPDQRLDTEIYSRDFTNNGSTTTRNVKITLKYSSLSGGNGTLYGSSSQSFPMVLAGETKTFSVNTDLSPNPSSWYYTIEVEAYVPDTSYALSAPRFSTGLISKSVFVQHPFVGDEGKTDSQRIVQE